MNAARSSADCIWLDPALVAALDERGRAVSDRAYSARFDGITILL